MRLSFFIFLYFPLIIFSQNTSHTNLWTRFTFSQTLSDKIKIDSELQYRTQNWFKCSNTPFDKNLMQSLRFWTSYKFNKNITFSISPFAYFFNYKLLKNESDLTKPINKEIRFASALDLQQELFKNFNLIFRTGYEYRNFIKSNDIQRFRQKFTFKYDFNEKYSISIFDEILMNINGVSRDHFYDHNRVGALFSLKLISLLKMETGYIYITRMQRNSLELIPEHNLILNFTISKKKEVKSEK